MYLLVLIPIAASCDYVIGLGMQRSNSKAARRLLLAHHKPDRTDEALDRLAARFRADPSITVAAEGQVIDLAAAGQVIDC